jgi:hypothetical protein
MQPVKGLIVLAVVFTACASAPAGTTSPAAAANGPCKEPFAGRTRGRGEAYGVGGVEGGVEGGLDRLGAGDQKTDALEGAVLRQVQLVHTSLGLGARSDGTATFEAPAGGSRLFLDARTPVPGYGWKVRISRASSGKMSFSVGCKKDQPRQTITWTFTLLDRKGRRSNVVDVPVECTGEPIPGPPPRLDEVALNAVDLPPGGKTAARATVSGGAPPLLIIGAATGRGNGWTSREGEQVWKESAFWVGCRGRSPQLLDWRFRVRDTYGRESNVIEKSLNCGGCR